ncbi:MAG: YtxH domain-containing protein [Chloroflexi bacterium]|nr:YtxH domain-containing protein [Chloroflexota bacterium]
MKRIFSFLMGTMLGALAGAALAILLTPQSGDDLRGGMRERVMNLKNELTSAASSRKIELERQLANLRNPESIGEG